MTTLNIYSLGCLINTVWFILHKPRADEKLKNYDEFMFTIETFKTMVYSIQVIIILLSWFGFWSLLILKLLRKFKIMNYE
jgi:hypothetical protein